VSIPRPAPSSIPDVPGAYLFRDVDGRVIYVGKAVSLRQRLVSYWSKPLHPRTAAMTEAAASVEWIVASGEVDALMLEYNLIQTHRPRFNIRYRDDKSYPYLAHGGARPRAQVLRGAKRKKVRTSARATCGTRTSDALHGSDLPWNSSTSVRQRPCLYYDTPLRRTVRSRGHRRHRGVLPGHARHADFLAGNARPVLRRLEHEMGDASEREEFEQAARLRDQLFAARRALERQEMVLSTPEDLDVVALAEDDLEAAFQVFFVRRGRVLGRKGWVVDRVEDLDRPQLIASVLEQLYMERPEVPPRVLVPSEPGDRGLLETWLEARRGGPVRIAVPARGAKRKLLEVVTSNAEEAFHRHKLRRKLWRLLPALAELADQLASSRRRSHRGTTLQPRSVGQGRIDGRVRGRPAEALGLPQVPIRESTDRTTSLRCRRRCADASRAWWTSSSVRRASARVASPTRRA
jgi:excinuclease ABC subunit C